MDTNLFNYFSQVDVELGILDEKKVIYNLVRFFNILIIKFL